MRRVRDLQADPLHPLPLGRGPPLAASQEVRFRDSLLSAFSGPAGLWGVAVGGVARHRGVARNLGVAVRGVAWDCCGGRGAGLRGEARRRSELGPGVGETVGVLLVRKAPLGPEDSTSEGSESTETTLAPAHRSGRQNTVGQ